MIAAVAMRSKVLTWPGCSRSLQFTPGIFFSPVGGYRSLMAAPGHPARHVQRFTYISRMQVMQFVSFEKCITFQKPVVKNYSSGNYRSSVRLVHDLLALL
jgi:hypothetical protein